MKRWKKYTNWNGRECVKKEWKTRPPTRVYLVWKMQTMHYVLFKNSKRNLLQFNIKIYLWISCTKCMCACLKHNKTAQLPVWMQWTSFCSILYVKSMHSFLIFSHTAVDYGLEMTHHSLIVNLQKHKKESDIMETTPNAKCDENMLIN